MLDSLTIEKHYGATHIAPYPITLTEGEGIYLHDSKGNKYIDMVSGISVVNFGHKPSKLVDALVQQANKIAIVPRLFHNEPVCQLMQLACEQCQMDKAIPMNSGAEAVETAIKVARKWGYVEKKIPDNQAEILFCNDNFHGRTITAISASSIDKYKDNFGPLTPGFKCIPFNNAAALEAAITPNTAAFIVEPIQGEGGVIIPDDGYLKACEAICKKHNVMFILDEIQSGMGRTGKLLAAQYETVNPDGILLGKALGGGLLPISLFLAKDHLMQVIKPGEHGGTFGGNPLASFVAYNALKQLLETDILNNTIQVGTYFIEKLKTIKSDAIKEVRGRGLFIAIELEENTTCAEIFEKFLKKGLLSIATRNNCIRLLPPLIITKAQVDEAMKIIQSVL